MVIELIGVQLIWSEIIRVISKSDKRATPVRFEMTSIISDQNCTRLSSFTTTYRFTTANFKSQNSLSTNILLI